MEHSVEISSLWTSAQLEPTYSTTAYDTPSAAETDFPRVNLGVYGPEPSNDAVNRARHISPLPAVVAYCPVMNMATLSESEIVEIDDPSQVAVVPEQVAVPTSLTINLFAPSLGPIY
ncbi:hypothetical protein ES703_62357 [subsurface metagenome]